jgi:endonuclease YncB( thermonuclease family)
MKAMRPALLLLLMLAASVAVSGSAAVSPAIVASVTDGDTVRLADGHRVRLLQIDTPELGTGECYSRAARKALLRLVPERSAVGLESDPALDQIDRYGRLLRYLRRGSTNVNLALVREGAAAPYFYDGDTGRYADRLLSAAIAAKAARRGLWGACPGTNLDPFRQVETQEKDVTPPRPLAPRAGCDPSYPTVCIPPYPPDLDCDDVPAKRFKVVGTDPHGFDGDRDGIGCET